MQTIHGPNGKVVNVTKTGRLETYAVTVSLEHDTNKRNGEAYSWYFTDDADANDDCIFYLKNNDDRDLVLEGMNLYVTSDAEVYIKLGGVGTTNSSATAVVGCNMNAGSGNVADVTALHDGDIQAGATFSSSTECLRYKYTDGTSYDTHDINYPMDIIIPKNSVFSIWCGTAGVVIQCTIFGFFDDSE